MQLYNGNVTIMVNLEHGKWSAWARFWALTIVVLGGCSPFGRKFDLSDLQSQDPRVRIMAIKWAGDNEVWAAVPHVVDSLQSEDQAVRFYAIEALRRITGADHGYDYKAAPHERAAAVKRWREFLDSKQWQNDGH